MPVLFYPANYYIHFVFLLPLLVDEPLKASSPAARVTSGRVWVIVLGLCAAQYFTVKEQALDLHFYNASVLLMVATFLVLWSLLPRDETGDLLLPTLLFRGLETEGAALAASGTDLVELPASESQRPPVGEEGKNVVSEDAEEESANVAEEAANVEEPLAKADASSPASSGSSSNEAAETGADETTKG
jgi:hypothetical protein